MDRLPSNTLFRFATISPVGDREFQGVAATSGLKDDKVSLDMSGGDLSRFKDGKAPLLLQHDSTKIIGTSRLRRSGDSLILHGRFASPGVSAAADEASRLLRDGVLNAISLGFAIKESRPLGQSRRDGILATKWEALECSLVAVGLDPEAVVTQRALSQLLARSGRRLSVETLRSLHAALEHHRTAMRSQRDANALIEELVARDDDMGGGDDGGERARLKARLAVMRRRQKTLTPPAAATERIRTLRELERLRAVGARY